MFYVVGPGASRGPADGGAAVGGALGVCSSLAGHPGSLVPPARRERGGGGFRGRTTGAETRRSVRVGRGEGGLGHAFGHLGASHDNFFLVRSLTTFRFFMDHIEVIHIESQTYYSLI